jgi:DNA-binding NarL/FixJ family response regulator
MILEAANDLEVVGEASDGEQAVAVTSRLRPDVVLMDIQMPKMDGLDATRRVGQEEDIHSRVLILTTFEQDEYVFEALRAGARGSCSRMPLRRSWSKRCVSWPMATRSSLRPSPAELARTTPSGQPHARTTKDSAF